jgi:hypothetical protein
MGQAKDSRVAMRSTRSGVSRKLLTRKAIEKTELPPGEALEASFPSATIQTSEETADAPCASSIEPTVAPAKPTAAPAVWSSEDEASFQALLARRKAAGYQRRGKDLSNQLLKLGEIHPNDNTIPATIVALAADRGELTRGELIDLMASADFPHPKARPADRSWCQGYVSGAIRNGFLAVVPNSQATSH